jgi:glucose/mannose-6-phosphate isomerase
VKEELDRVGAPSVQLHTEGDSRLERVLSAVLLGDLVSVYMAVLAGVDPTETAALTRLKEQL